VPQVARVDTALREELDIPDGLADPRVFVLDPCHILNNFGRGVPDAELLAEFGVEGFEERLVEVLDGLGFDEAGEEFGALDAVEGGRGPIENFDKAKGTEPGGGGDLLEKSLDHGDVQGPSGGAPIEIAFAMGIFLVPEDPGGEDTVEKCLDEGGAEEMLAFIVLELHAEGFLEGGADGGEGRKISDGFDAGACVAGVGGEEEGDVFGIVQGRGGEEDALEVFEEALAENGRGFARIRSDGPERFFVGSEVEGFEMEWVAVIATLEEKEAAVIGDENETVLFYVAAHLGCAGEGVEGGVGGLDFEDAAGRGLDAEERSIFVGVAELIGREKAAIGKAGAFILGMD
jgi:hypothetical protein